MAHQPHPNAEAICNDLMQKFEADPGQFEMIDVRTSDAAAATCTRVSHAHELVKDIVEQEFEAQLTLDEPEYDVLALWVDPDSIVKCTYSIMNRQGKILLLYKLDTTHPKTPAQWNYCDRQKGIINEALSDVLKEQYGILLTENCQLKHAYELQEKDIDDLKLQHQEEIDDLKQQHQEKDATITEKDATIGDLEYQLAIAQTRLSASESHLRELRRQQQQQPPPKDSSGVQKFNSFMNNHGGSVNCVEDESGTKYHLDNRPDPSSPIPDEFLPYDGGGRSARRTAPPTAPRCTAPRHTAPPPTTGTRRTAPRRTAPPTSGTRRTRTATRGQTTPARQSSRGTHYYDGSIPQTPLRSSRHQGSYQPHWNSPNAERHGPSQDGFDMLGGGGYADDAESIDPMPSQEQSRNGHFQGSRHGHGHFKEPSRRPSSRRDDSPGDTIPSQVDFDGGSDAHVDGGGDRYHYSSRNYASRGAGAGDSHEGHNGSNGSPYMEQID